MSDKYTPVVGDRLIGATGKPKRDSRYGSSWTYRVEELTVVETGYYKYPDDQTISRAGHLPPCVFAEPGGSFVAVRGDNDPETLTVVTADRVIRGNYGRIRRGTTRRVADFKLGWQDVQSVEEVVADLKAGHDAAIEEHHESQEKYGKERHPDLYSEDFSYEVETVPYFRLLAQSRIASTDVEEWNTEQWLRAESRWKWEQEQQAARKSLSQSLSEAELLAAALALEDRPDAALWLVVSDALSKGRKWNGNPETTVAVSVEKLTQAVLAANAEVRANG